MDIDILYALQTFREGSGAFLKEFLAKMTWFGELNTVMVIMAVIYWCFSKETGTYLLTGWCANRFVNGFLKITACVYRPWIRDARIVPDADAIKTATGYSFPSGHTMNAATLFGGGAIWYRSGKVFRILLWVMVFLVGFSRLYLSVHTPQDVLIGAAAGILVMFLTGILLKWVDAHQEKDILVTVAGILLFIALAVYAALKPYPEDYAADGSLLVDGAKMANDTFKGVGWCSAFLIGWLLERRLVKFSTEINTQERLFRLGVGLLGYYIVTLIICPPVKSALGGAAGTMVSCFLQMFYITFLFPVIFDKFRRSYRAVETSGKE